MLKLILLTIACLATSITASVDRAAAQSATMYSEAQRQINQLYQAKRYKEAIVLAEQELRKVQEKYGPSHPQIAQWLLHVARLYQRDGQWQPARSLITRAIEQTETAFAPDDPAVVQLISSIAVQLQFQRRSNEAVRILKRAYKVAEKTIDPKSQIFWVVTMQLSSTYTALGRPASATPYLERLLALQERGLGRNHVLTAQTMSELGQNLQTLSRFREAEPLLREAIPVLAKAFGDGDYRTIGAQVTMGDFLTSSGRYSDAVKHFGRLLQEMDGKGANVLHAVAVRGRLAFAELSRGNYRDAEKYFKASIETSDRLFGKNFASSAQNYSGLANVYLGLGQFEKAETYAKRGVELSRIAGGDKSPLFAASLVSLAEVLVQRYRFDQADNLLRHALAIQRQAFGDQHPIVANTLVQFGSVKNSLGEMDVAENTLKASLSMLVQSYGERDLRVAGLVNALGNMYVAKGNYSEAENLFKKALAIQESVREKAHPSVTESLNNLGELYIELQRFDEAELLIRRGLAVAEETYGKDSPSVANSLNSLARLHQRMNRLEESETLHQRSLNIRRKTFGAKHNLVAQSLNNLATLLQNKQEFERAEGYLKQSIEITRANLGDDHLLVGQGITNLASLMIAKKDFTEAGSLLKAGKSRIIKNVGEDHLNLTTIYHYEALVHLRQGNFKAARSSWLKAIKILSARAQYQILDEANDASKAEPQRYWPYFHGLIKTTFRIASDDRERRPGFSQRMFQAAQLSLGSKTGASLSQMAARSAAGTLQLDGLVRKLQDLTAKRASIDKQITFARSQPMQERDLQHEQELKQSLVDTYSQIAEGREQLSREFPAYASLAFPRQSSIEEVQSQLRDDEALVYFFSTPKAEPLPEETFVWVITKKESRWVSSAMGPTELRDHVDALRCGLDFNAWQGTRCFDLLGTIYSSEDRQQGKPLPFQLKRAHNLYKGLFGQVEDLIKGKSLLVVPTGPLSRLPFQALVTAEPEQSDLSAEAFGKAAWLTNHHAVIVLPSVSSLDALRRNAGPSRATEPFIGFGNPLLNGPDQRFARRAAEARERQRCREDAREQVTLLGRIAAMIGWRATDPNIQAPSGKLAAALVRRQTPLPETADELCAVAKDAGAPPGDVYLGARATEQQLKQLSTSGALAKYKVLHFATHGALAREFTETSEPGLLMTPPDEASGQAEDGYLSATEVARLKLDADWVILSACNTAGGESENGEALSGLAKAFFYAGARSLLVSHWYVNSHATVSLITRTFSELRRNPGIGRTEALRRAMLALMQDDRRLWHPEYWSPFVVVGEGAG